MATCDIAALMVDAKAFQGAGANLFEMLKLQLLCEIAAVAGGGAAAAPDQIRYYTADPNTEAVVPDDQTIGAICLPVDGTGPWFMWNTATLTWV